MFKLLPEPICVVTIPEFFSPSSWDRLNACRMSVFCSHEPELPDAIEAIVGKILHVVRERTLNSDCPTGRLVDALSEVIEEFDKKLAGTDNGNLVPLLHTVGRQAWSTKLSIVRASLSGPLLQFGRRVGEPVPAAQPVPAESQVDRMPLGIEQKWRCKNLRLTGRVDQAFRDQASGRVVIVDFKSGRVATRDGELLPGIAAQLRLYALIARKLGDPAQKAIIGGSEYVEHTFSDEELDLFASAFREFLDANPAGAALSASEAASPGSVCRFCRLRPQCSKYLEAAPAMWSNDGDQPRPLPMDAWGRVIDLRHEAVGSTVRLVDPMGREVVIRGVVQEKGDESIDFGSYLFAFNLLATQDCYQHGRVLHPRSFHVEAPGKRWKSALQARIYLR